MKPEDSITVLNVLSVLWKISVLFWAAVTIAGYHDLITVSAIVQFVIALLRFYLTVLID